MPEMVNQDTVRLLLDGGNTRGLAAVVEYTIAPRGEGPGLHWHRTFDEYFYVVSGQLSVQAAGHSRLFGPRDFVFVPRGIVHDFWNDSASAACVFLSGWTPAGSEGVWKADELPDDVRRDPVRLHAALEALMDTVPVQGPRLPVSD
ncbi:cupin domain-containing protein [Mycobacteroides abscessus]|uniref:cupin domain-containing protein n=1 Tax=Mycobacteroides abscessus TaxID=36809 RepID=UPI0009412B95|nr:cupin domain-containing protein [Mycobacteroides abscessus]MDO3104577.1 cupin domain-containing protein [Mycobacteroides abscessus subsp. abscessus]